MGNYEQLKQAVSDVIKTNGNREIAGAILQNALLSIISTIGKNATFAGIANPNTNPGTPDQNIFYLVNTPGEYVNFNNISISDGIYYITNKDGNWVANKIGSSTAYSTAGILKGIKKTSGFSDATRIDVSIEKNRKLKVEWLFDNIGTTGARLYANAIGTKALIAIHSLSGSSEITVDYDINKLILYTDSEIGSNFRVLVKSVLGEEKVQTLSEEVQTLSEKVQTLSEEAVYFEDSINEIQDVVGIPKTNTFTSLKFEYSNFKGVSFDSKLDNPTIKAIVNNISEISNISRIVLYIDYLGDNQVQYDLIKTDSYFSREVSAQGYLAGAKIALYFFGTGNGTADINVTETGNILNDGLVQRVEVLEEKVENLQDPFVSPFKGMVGIVLGDSHASNRSKWAPKLFEMIGATYDEETANLAIRTPDQAYPGYEMYGDVFLAQAIRAVELYKAGKKIDIIVAENVHYTANDDINTAFPLIVKKGVNIGDISVTNVTEYFNENISTILSGTPPTLGTMVYGRNAVKKYTLTFNGTPTPGECSILLDGQTFTATVEEGDTINDVVEKLGIWSFGDYTDWSNTFSVNVITITYKGSEIEIPQPNVSFNAGTTGVSMQTNEIASYAQFNKYFMSYLTSDWEDYTKWKNVGIWAGFSGLKGFYQTLLDGIPGIIIICAAFPCYGITQNQYKTDLGANMMEFYSSSFYTTNRKRADTFIKAGQYYNCPTIDVEKLCNITLSNWFEFNPSGDVHPNRKGYIRWAETVAKNIL